MAESRTSDEELSAFGLTREDGAATEDQIVEVWPDNWEAVGLFVDLLTQWRHSMSGPTGLDYAAVLALMKLRGVRRKRRSDLLDDLRVMETALLSAIREKQ